MPELIQLAREGDREAADLVFAEIYREKPMSFGYRLLIARNLTNKIPQLKARFPTWLSLTTTISERHNTIDPGNPNSIALAYVTEADPLFTGKRSLKIGDFNFYCDFLVDAKEPSQPLAFFLLKGIGLENRHLIGILKRGERGDEGAEGFSIIEDSCGPECDVDQILRGRPLINIPLKEIIPLVTAFLAHRHHPETVALEAIFAPLQMHLKEPFVGTNPQVNGRCNGDTCIRDKFHGMRRGEDRQLTDLVGMTGRNINRKFSQFVNANEDKEVF